ncbi:PepSY domain-containing protein [Daejeonella sp.]|uniref:PepSY domain-containing protein n=1 Tax=Daejeonella sp. TaxID=2805397 RepID=UPI0039836D6C
MSALLITKSLSSLVRGIHFIEYGNFWIKLFFCLIGLSGPVLSITGFLLWKWKKKA